MSDHFSSRPSENVFLIVSGWVNGPPRVADRVREAVGIGRAAGGRLVMLGAILIAAGHREVAADPVAVVAEGQPAGVHAHRFPIAVDHRRGGRRQAQHTEGTVGCW